MLLFFNSKLNNHPFENMREKFKKESFLWDDRLSERGAQLRISGIWQSWDVDNSSRDMTRQSCGGKGDEKNKRESLKDTRNVSHGR